MFRLPRPDSTIFRLTLALALLAWTALAFGAPSVELGAMQAPPQQAQVANASAHCHDTMTMSADPHRVSTPMAPAGHHDRCQTACHCLAASTAVMIVPWIFVAFAPSGRHWSAGAEAPIRQPPAAPPLRPPIA